MPTVTTNLDDTTYERAEEEMKAQGLNMSRFLRMCVENYLEDSVTVVRPHDIIEPSDKLLEEKDAHIKDLQESLKFLQLQYAELSLNIKGDLINDNKKKELAHARNDKEKKKWTWPWSRKKNE